VRRKRTAPQNRLLLSLSQSLSNRSLSQNRIPSQNPFPPRRLSQNRSLSKPVAEHVPATAPAPEADDEAVREELRQVARTKGVVWLREILASYQAARLGDLTIAQVQEALHAAAQ
jgi:hypothetical protein